MRRILGDRWTGSIPALLVAYVMLLQGLVSAYAQGALATPQPGPDFVICSLTGAVPGTRGSADHSPLERAAHHCCAALCHAATSHSPILPAADLGPAFVPEASPPVYFRAGQSARRATVPRLLPQPRAPPSISI